MKENLINQKDKEKVFWVKMGYLPSMEYLKTIFPMEYANWKWRMAMSLQENTVSGKNQVLEVWMKEASQNWFRLVIGLRIHWWDRGIISESDLSADVWYFILVIAISYKVY